MNKTASNILVEAAKLATIEGEDIVIRITPKALLFGTENCPIIQKWSTEYNKYYKIKVRDMVSWRDSVIRELLREKEDGTTLIHLLLDKAVVNALENGEEGIDFVQ